MSEVMISESIIEAEWILEGYWTKMRFAYQTGNSAWSDVDMLAYNPEKKHLVISESKVGGSKKDVYAYTKSTRDKYGPKHESKYSILTYDEGVYFSFLNNLPMICKTVFSKSNFEEMVKKITVQLVSNYVVQNCLKEEENKIVCNRIREILSDVGIKAEISVRIDSTIDIISKVIDLEDKHRQGRRYGHPMLDIAREINRYVKPNIHYAGKDKDSIKSQMIKLLKDTIGC